MPRAGASRPAAIARKIWSEPGAVTACLQRRRIGFRGESCQEKGSGSIGPLRGPCLRDELPFWVASRPGLTGGGIRRQKKPGAEVERCRSQSDLPRRVLRVRLVKLPVARTMRAWVPGEAGDRVCRPARAKRLPVHYATRAAIRSLHCTAKCSLPMPRIVVSNRSKPVRQRASPLGEGERSPRHVLRCASPTLR